MRTPRRARFVVWAFALGLGLLILWGMERWESQRERQIRTSFLMGDPHSGSHLFSSKGCANCHALFGQGGGEAPDLGRVPRRHASLNELVSEMWNHAPRMWASLRQKRVEYVDISSREMTDIFAFLYTVRYVDQPGDVERGGRLFREKGCSQCHGARGGDVKNVADVTTPSFADTPISWVRALWNHAVSPSQNKLRQPPITIKLEGDEVPDLIAFVQSVGTGSRQESRLLPADLQQGALVFKRKGCAVCHASWLLGPRADLWLRGPAGWPHSIPQLAGAMWNHFPQLQRLVKTDNRFAFTLDDKEAVDLVAFLYTLRSLDPPGDPAHGHEVYERKGCVVCHGSEAAGSTLAPSLQKLRGSFSPIFLAETMWKHGPKIYEKMTQRGIAWPTLEVQEMNDLIAFLNSR